MTGARRTPIFGPEPWAQVAGVGWCHFDRWFALVAAYEFDGDLDRLQVALEQRLRSLTGRRDVEAKLSHLADLCDRLTGAGLDAATLAGQEPVDKPTWTKARRKVFDQALEHRSRTEPMRRTPRVRLEQRARRGQWQWFPVSPAGWYQRLGGDRSTGFVGKGGSFAVTRSLQERLARSDRPGLPLGERLALYRAFHTIGLELADRTDDSYGVIGELRLDAFRTYLSIDPAAAGMPAEHYWQDLCELLVAESYALTHCEQTLPFQQAGERGAELIEAILLDLAGEWEAAYQDYHGEQARELVAWLHLAGHRYHRYVETGRLLGSAAWMPIVALAESALTADNRPLAIDVFRAADQPGTHRDYLRQRCLQLTGTALDDDDELGERPVERRSVD